jgi:hypothetical protein
MQNQEFGASNSTYTERAKEDKADTIYQIIYPFCLSNYTGPELSRGFLHVEHSSVGQFLLWIECKIKKF